MDHQFGGGSWPLISNIPTSNLTNTSSSSSIPSNQDDIFLNPQQLHPQYHLQQQQQQHLFHPSQQAQNQFLQQSQSPQQQLIQQSPQQQLQSQFMQQSPQQQQSQFMQQSPQQQQFIQQSPQQQQFIQQSPQQQQPFIQQSPQQQQPFIQQSPQQQQPFIQQSPQLQQQFIQQSPQQQIVQQPPLPPQHQQRFQQQQQNHPDQSLASQFHLFPLVERLALVTESGTRDQQTDALINELTTQFDKCQQLLNSISGSITNAKALTVEGQKRKVEESNRLLNQRRDLLSKYKSSVEELTRSGP